MYKFFSFRSSSFRNIIQEVDLFLNRLVIGRIDIGSYQKSGRNIVTELQVLNQPPLHEGNCFDGSPCVLSRLSKPSVFDFPGSRFLIIFYRASTGPDPPWLVISHQRKTVTIPLVGMSR